LNSQTTAKAQDALAVSASVATMARRAAAKSPYAAGFAKAAGIAGDTTPGIRKLNPTNRNM
jgi:hypothetical protein